MEQIKILPDKRDGKDSDKILLNYRLSTEGKASSHDHQIKLKVSNTHIWDVIEKFGADVEMLPLDNNYSIATANVSITPSLYLWTLQFRPRIEIIFPENAEKQIREYFAEIAEGKQPIPPFF